MLNRNHIFKEEENEKKALSLFLVTAMAVSMVGCGSKDADKNTEKKDTEVAVATEKKLQQKMKLGRVT